MKRKSIPQRTRFEVFKRDKFVCQYCGAKAPDVILVVDHINAVANGGDNSLINLITSCVACNSGKSSIRLNDDTAVAKARAQMEQLEERRQQLKMMLDWRESLITAKDEETDIAVAHWNEIIQPVNRCLSEQGRKMIEQWRKTFSLAEILDGMDEAALSYFKDATEEMADLSFSKVPAVCRCRRMDAENPALKELYYIRGILRNRLEYYDGDQALSDLQSLYDAGYELQSIKKLCRSVSSWSKFQRCVADWLDASSE